MQFGRFVSMALVRGAFVLGALASLAPFASAQLELPDRPARPLDRERTLDIVPERRGDLAPKRAGQEKPTEQLDLPQQPVDTRTLPGAAAPARPTVEVAPSPLRVLPSQPSSATVRPTDGATTYILDQLKRVGDVEHRLVDQAVASLLGLGDDGRAAARYALATDHPPTMLAGAKTLLSNGDPHDADLVVARLRGRFHTGAGQHLVDALAERNPVLASPRFLCELLGHPQGAVRAAAHKHLAAQVDAEILPYLRLALGCDQSEGRLRAVELTSEIEGPEALAMLLERLKDRSGTVAARAASRLSTRRDPELEGELLGRAFRLQWVLREGAYALLAIIEREDARLTPILSAAHVEPLLQGMSASDPFVSGACAAALAGIGFRLPSGEATRWLDRDVPLKLLRVLAGGDFSADYGSLFTPAARRLSMLAGETFGADGPAWLEWWSRQGDGFVAMRAAMVIEPSAIGALSLYFVANDAHADAFALVGPQVVEPRAGSIGETLRLSAPQVVRLHDALLREGWFSAERLPGVRGGAQAAGRSIEVVVGETWVGAQHKLFRFAGDQAESWFERGAAVAFELRGLNVWQRYRDPELHATDLAFWQAEHAWWDEHGEPLERALRLKGLVFAALARADASQRARGIDELARLYQDPRVVDSNDFAALLALLEGETGFGDRARTLAALAERSALALAPADAAEPRPLDPTLARDLALRLGESFGAAASGEMARLLAAAGRPAVREAAKAPEPMLRAIAAAELAREPSAEDVETLLALLVDPVQPVEISAVIALGENRVEAARNELVARARHADAKVRVVALEAIGKLGGDGAFDVLLSALHDELDVVQAAAARGLAALGDPNSISLFVSLLARGRESPLFEPTQRALLAFGEAAWPELQSVARASAARGKREAAMLLSLQGVPDAAPVLMTLYSESPADEVLASELAILTCVDMRRQENPPGAWWEWWDGVVQDDSGAWLRAALERLDVKAPAPEALGPSGTREGFEFLLAVVARPETHLSERGRRELVRMVGRELGALPSPGAERDAWIGELRARCEQRFE